MSEQTPSPGKLFTATKALNIPDRLVTSITVQDAVSQARHPDAAALTDETDVDQINSRNH